MKALEGIRVLDFTHAISGPTCTSMLALMGADVVKVEQRGGDGARGLGYGPGQNTAAISAPFAAINNTKRSITADLRNPKAKEAIRKLAAKADILVENFRPGKLAKQGFGYEDLRKDNPRLIYASITGFGQTGYFRDYGAYDHIIQAASGLAMLNAGPNGPVQSGIPLMDSFGGYMGVMGILAALEKRHRTGEGEYVDVAMLEAAMKLLNTNISLYFQTGVAPKSMAGRGFRLVATSEFYKTADGWMALGASQQHQFEAFLKVVGHSELLEDARFADHQARVANYDEVKAWLTAFMLTQNAEDLEPKLAAAGVPGVMVRDIAQISAHEQWKDRDFFKQVATPGGGELVTTMGPGFHFASGPMDPGPVPALGQHTDEILREVGYGDKEIAEMKSAGAF